MADTPLPLRQKIFVTITALIGFFIILFYQLQVIPPKQLSIIILFYSSGVSMYLLVSQTLLDLNNHRIFTIWLTIGFIHFLFYLLARDNIEFRIIKNPGFDKNNFINKHISDIAASSLKTLLIFLIAFKIFNGVMKRLTGNILLNTYGQLSWKHDLENRKITIIDVVFNILLFLTIAISTLTR